MITLMPYPSIPIFLQRFFVLLQRDFLVALILLTVVSSVVPPAHLHAFDADEDAEEAADAFDQDSDTQTLLDRQREDLNRPFSIIPPDNPEDKPSDGPLKQLPGSPASPTENLPGGRDKNEEEAEEDPSSNGSLPETQSNGKENGQPSPGLVETPLVSPALSGQTATLPSLLIPPDALAPEVFSGGNRPKLFGPFSPIPWVGPAEGVAVAPVHVTDQGVGLSPESAALVPGSDMESAKTEEIETIYHVPIVYNEYVAGYLTLFQTRLRERFEVWLARSGRYVPMMQSILKRKEIPEDLVFLALIESGFNPQAHSVASAVGPWQFIKTTGERYGLRVDKWIDERRDPVKSTVAAARYLKDLYRMFQSWSLSMASYNAGEGRIMRALASSKTEDFWQLKETAHIKDETKNYVPKFMAATIIAKNPEKYGFFVDYHEPLSYEEVKVSKQTSLKSIAKAVGVSVQQIQSYNPELKRDTTPPNYPGYHIKIPHGTKDRFLAAFSKSLHRQTKKKIVISPKKRGKKRRGSKNHLTQLPPEKTSDPSS